MSSGTGSTPVDQKDDPLKRAKMELSGARRFPANTARVVLETTGESANRSRVRSRGISANQA
jgi:hypothetical protein